LLTKCAGASKYRTLTQITELGNTQSDI